MIQVFRTFFGSPKALKFSATIYPAAKSSAQQRSNPDFFVFINLSRRVVVIQIVLLFHKI